MAASFMNKGNTNDHQSKSDTDEHAIMCIQNRITVTVQDYKSLKVEIILRLKRPI